MVGPEFVHLFLRVGEVAFWFPRIILRRITDPANEVFRSFVFVVEDLFDFVFLIAFFDVCWWGVYAVPW